MSKHTPGPWILVGSEVHDRPTRFDDDGVRVGETPCMIASASIMPNKGQREANARLIAAAPELLEALRNMVEWYGHRHGMGLSDVLFPIAQQPSQIQAAMSAIAKATGGDA
jgi:hypothetical protein